MGTSSDTIFKKALALRTKTLGALNALINQLPSEGEVHLIDQFYLEDGAYALLSWPGQPAIEKFLSKLAEEKVESYLMPSPHEKFFENYLYLDGVKEPAATILILDTKSYFNYCAALNASLAEGLRILDHYWPKGGTSGGFIIATSDSSGFADKLANLLPREVSIQELGSLNRILRHHLGSMT